eukprot:8265102-Prorocentrum_lima.AAC.1
MIPRAQKLQRFAMLCGSISPIGLREYSPRVATKMVPTTSRTLVVDGVIEDFWVATRGLGIGSRAIGNR